MPHGLTDLDAALALPGVAAVTIATPPAAHAEAAIAAVKAGKHVLCEKPFAMDTTQAAAMLDAAAAAGVVHLVGHEFRWAVDRATVGRAIAEGMIGEPRLATLVMHSSLVADLETKTPPWWFDPVEGGGWLGASGSHIVDMVRVWLGEFDEVSARLGVTSERTGVAEDSFTVRFRLQSGVEGVLQQAAAAWGPYAGMTRVVGTRGTVWIDGDAPYLADADGVRRLPVPPISSCRARRRRATTRAIGSRISSSGRSRGCARCCAPRSTAARCPTPCRSRRLPMALRACWCSTRSVRRPNRGYDRGGPDMTALNMTAREWWMPMGT